MEEKIRRGRLYDFYGELLSDHQREIYEAYVIEDLSMTEIAEQVGLTKQGVSDQIRRCTVAMDEYENVLHLVERFTSIEERLAEISDIARDAGIDRIVQLSDEIFEEL